MAKLLSQRAFCFSKRDYLVDSYDNGSMVVHRQKAACAVGSLQGEKWVLTGGRPALFRAAVTAIGGTVCEESLAT